MRSNNFDPAIPAVAPPVRAQWDQPSAERYQSSLSREIRRYESCVDVHDLPDIFHYWTNLHILPKLLPFGFSSPNEMFLKYLGEQCEAEPHRAKRFVSIGCGNCDLEIKIALELAATGKHDFVFDCVDINPSMLQRGKAMASDMNVARHFSWVQADFNSWSPSAEYDAAIANQSLHHVVNLEHLCGRLNESLRPGGSFVISDMIGRNGHQRWPEALEIVHEFWRTLPPSYRFNWKSRRYEDLYENHDCSGDGFEGIRSQEILPILLEHFSFPVFIPFANAIDPFVDRAFGPNFNPSLAWDRAFIDTVHARDEAEFAAGRLTPTHLLAVAVKKTGLCLGISPQVSLRPAPESCVRLPGRNVPVPNPARLSPPAAAPQHGPHGVERELEIACARLKNSADWIRQLTDWSSDLDAARLRLEVELKRRTEWALDLDRQVELRTAWARELERESEARAARALALESELQDHRKWALTLQAELDERTAWALRLRDQLEDQRQRSALLEGEIKAYIHNPFRLMLRIAGGIRNRLLRAIRLSD